MRKLTVHGRRADLRVWTGFTLVELLVVIGIIAVLIGVLLPALSAARRSAMQVKCAAALQEVGLGFLQYANDQKQWYPAAKCGIGNYTIGDVTFTAGTDSATSSTHAAYWVNFIADYVNVNKAGFGAQSAGEKQSAYHSVLWGCPAWEHYVDTIYSSESQTGYGMNGFPIFTDSYPTKGTDEPPESCIVGTSIAPTGRFYKQNEWTNPAGRALVGDCLFWLMESYSPPLATSYPPGIAPQPAGGNNLTFTGPGQTLVDIYRHGKKPGNNGGGVNATFDPRGGKISYNLLFCDGHVGEFSEAQTAYMSLRQRFPF